MLISRDEVSEGEGGLTKIYKTGADFGFDDLMEFLKQEGFFCEVPKDSLWSMNYDGVEVGIYSLSSHFSYRRGTFGHFSAEDSGNLHFKFFLNGKERAKYLFRLYCGNKRDMYFDGYMWEYQRYHIEKEIEQTWRDILIQEKIYQDYDENEDIKEAVLFLKQVMIRPGMYVGQHRLDLVRIFYDGWCTGRKTLWNINSDLEQWVFLKESISSTASINGWTMFFVTYGVTDTGIANFREFLEHNVPSNVLNRERKDTVSGHLSPICFNLLYPEGPKPELKPYLDFRYDEHITEEEAYLEIVRQIKRIIGKDCKCIKAFLNLGRIVLQVRFLFDDGSGWKDGISLASTPNYYEKLIVLHGYVKLLDKKRLNASIVTIDWSEEGFGIQHEDYQPPKLQFNVLPHEEYLMSCQFSAWRLKAGYFRNVN